MPEQFPLLALLRDNMNMVPALPAKDSPGGRAFDTAKTLPPTMIYDRVGHDITSVIQAFHYGARDYVLASAPEAERELAARPARRALPGVRRFLESLWRTAYRHAGGR